MKRCKSNSKLFLCIFIVIAVIAAIYFLSKLYINRNDSEKDSNNLFDYNKTTVSGENTGVKDGEYNVSVYDDQITFSDGNGNSIVYSFSDNHLTNVQEILVLNNASEVDEVKAYYEAKIKDGEIERVISDGNVISVKYNIDYFGEYKDYTKDEIESMLIGDENTEYND